MSDPKILEVAFQCRPCRHTWHAEPSRIEGEGDDPLQLDYFANCPKCGAETGQAFWQRGLWHAEGKRTGPRTAEGKARCAENLANMTPEQKHRAKYNNVRHGRYLKQMTPLPAKPDGYQWCAGCEIERDYCRAQPVCLLKAGHFVLVRAAFEEKKPELLNGIFSEAHGMTLMVLREMLLAVLQQGVSREVPKVVLDKDGAPRVLEVFDQDGNLTPVMQQEINQLLRVIPDWISRIGLSLNDLGMTPKQIDDGEAAMGRLKADEDNREALEAFEQRKVKALEDLSSMIQRANAAKARDPVLIEYNQQNGG